jgi:hypothetical protein
MAIDKSILFRMECVSHRDYFRRYKLNVEQYGEILVAEAFGGEKKGDAQVGYDIEVGIEALRRLEITAFSPSREDGSIRIEVKSKLSRTNCSQASVVHCNDCKLNGSKSKKGILRRGMTHLVILLVNPGSRLESGDGRREGWIENAWLLSRAEVERLRRKDIRSSCIYVRDLRHCPITDSFLEITSLLNDAANAPVRA